MLNITLTQHPEDTWLLLSTQGLCLRNTVALVFDQHSLNSGKVHDLMACIGMTMATAQTQAPQAILKMSPYFWPSGLHLLGSALLYSTPSVFIVLYLFFTFVYSIIIIFLNFFKSYSSLSLWFNIFSHFSFHHAIFISLPAVKPLIFIHSFLTSLPLPLCPSFIPFILHFSSFPPPTGEKSA